MIIEQLVGGEDLHYFVTIIANIYYVTIWADGYSNRTVKFTIIIISIRDKAVYKFTIFVKYLYMAIFIISSATNVMPCKSQ